MADIYVSRRCAVVSQTLLVFSWTGQDGTWVLVAMNGFLWSTDLTWMAGVGSLLWLVDCALELWSGFPLDKTCNKLASGSLKGTGSETVVYQMTWLSWQGAQTGLTGWTDRRK